MNVPARLRQSFDVRGDMREPLVHDACVDHPVGARQASPGRKIRVARTTHDREAVRTAVGWINGKGRLGAVARVQR